MRKFITAIAVLSFLFISSNNTFAQSDDFAGNANFEQGQIDVNAGLGLIPTFFLGGFRAVIPPVSLSVDYAIDNEISVGGFVGIARSRNKTFSDVKYNYTLIGVRGAYHFNLTEGLDTYAGAMVGFNRVAADFDNSIFTDFSASNSFLWSIYGGARYPFADNLGVFGELGYGISYITVGVTAKL